MLAGLFAALFMPGKALAIESAGRRLSYVAIWKNFLAALFPIILTVVSVWGIWWYVVIHPLTDIRQEASVATEQSVPAPSAPATQQAGEEKLQELGSAGTESNAPTSTQEPGSVEQVGTPELL